MATDNMTIMEKAWLEGTWDFQQRVPDPTQYGVAQSTRAILDPYNGNVYNEFLQTLNMIAMTEIHQTEFEHEFQEFKKPGLFAGQSVRQVAPKWFKAHAYNQFEETLLKIKAPKYVEWFYSINRRDYYECDISRTDVSMSFIDDYGFQGNELIAKTTLAMKNSDKYDEMNIFLNLIGEADYRWDGLFKVVSTFPENEDTGKEFLAIIRAFAGRLKYPSKVFNSLDVPVFAKPRELILMITPEAKANVDVFALAPVFNLDQANIQPRVIEVPGFNIPGVYAMLTTVDFFYQRDTLYGIFPWFNPQTVVTSDYLHHQGIYAANPLVPAICFTTATGTTTPIIRMVPSELTLTAAETTVPIGGTVQLEAMLQGTVTPANNRVKVLPNSAVWDIAVSGGKKNTRTFVDRLGVLHVQKSDIAVGEKITVTATSTYVNPSGETTPYTASVELTVSERTDDSADAVRTSNVPAMSTEEAAAIEQRELAEEAARIAALPENGEVMATVSNVTETDTEGRVPFGTTITAGEKELSEE